MFQSYAGVKAETFYLITMISQTLLAPSVSKTRDSTLSTIKKPHLVWIVSEQIFILLVINHLLVSQNRSEQNRGQMSTLSQGYRPTCHLAKTKWTFRVCQERWQERCMHCSDRMAGNLTSFVKCLAPWAQISEA